MSDAQHRELLWGLYALQGQWLQWLLQHPTAWSSYTQWKSDIFIPLKRQFQEAC